MRQGPVPGLMPAIRRSPNCLAARPTGPHQRDIEVGKQLPFPGSLRTVTSPPSRRANSRLMARPKPRAARANAKRRLGELVEQPAEIGGSMPGPVSSTVVTSRQPSGACAVPMLPRDLATLGELHGVAEQVDEDLADLVLVRYHGGWQFVTQLDHQRQSLALRAQLEHGRDVADQRTQIEGGEVDVGAASFDLRHFQNVVDQRQQMLA
jgi:hypothetical protein